MTAAYAAEYNTYVYFPLFCTAPDLCLLLHFLFSDLHHVCYGFACSPKVVIE